MPPHAPDEATLSVLNEPESIRNAEAKVVEAIERHNYPKASLFAIRLSLHEAVSNAFRHGHSKLPPNVPVHVSYKVGNERIVLAVEDQGPGFNPDSVPDPTLEENLERGSGRGLLLIRSYMASAHYNRKGNRLEMVYKRPEEA
ncbi:MAG: ATP-binding protein [Planctomycetes bacterium]|nr:ATP-binding protein [Planctomycetota bacterium]